MSLYNCNFTLKSLNDTYSFKISSENEEHISQFFYAFLMLFPDLMNFETKTIQCFTYNSEIIKQNIRDFAETHKEIPELNGIDSFVRSLEEKEAFYVIPDFLPNQNESLRLTNYLKAYRDKTDYKELNKETDTLFGDLMDSYEIAVYGEKRRVIGDKNRGCRFCRKVYPDVTFKKKAHAISEALGNKTLVLKEECDECNFKFSQTIEPDLINYLAIYRTFYGIKGKGGTKEFKGKNFKLFKNETMELHFNENTDNVEDVDGFPTKIKLESGRKIASQNIYKTLVKYVLSIINSDKLVDFKNTIDWINGSLEIPTLPKIAEFSFYEQLIEQPILTVYTRTDENFEYPYMVGEFHFAFFKYIFIIPASDRDYLNFLEKDKYDQFWKKFKHYDILKSHATFKDFSDNTKRDFDIILNMNKSEKTKIS